MQADQSVLIVLVFNNMSTLMGHFVSSPREREKTDRIDSKDEREGQGRKRNRNESEGTEIKTFSPLPLPATRKAGLAQLEDNIGHTGDVRYPTSSPHPITASPLAYAVRFFFVFFFCIAC